MLRTCSKGTCEGMFSLLVSVSLLHFQCSETDLSRWKANQGRFPADHLDLFTVRLEEPVIRDIKPLSVDLDKTTSDLLTEAITDLVRKHGRTEVTYSTATPETKKGKKQES